MPYTQGDLEHLEEPANRMHMFPEAGQPFDLYNYFKRQAVITMKTYSSQDSLKRQWDLYAAQETSRGVENTKSFYTMWRKLLTEIPTYIQYAVMKKRNDRNSKPFEVKRSVFPKSKYKSKDYIMLRLDCRVDLDSLIEFHIKQHERIAESLEAKANGAGLDIDYFVDGVPHTKSTQKKMICQAIRFEGCEELYVFNTMLGLEKDVKLTGEDQVEGFIKELETCSKKVNVKFVIGDLVERVELAETVSYNADYGCITCVAKGVRVEGHNFTVWPFSTANDLLRDDRSWRDNAVDALEFGNCLGQRGYSMLNRIRNFTIPGGLPIEPMHCLFMGLVKQLIFLCFSVPDGPPQGFKDRIIEMMNECFVHTELPTEIDRQARGLDLPRWKSNEFKVFCVVVGHKVAEGFALLGHEAYAELWFLLCFTMRAMLMPDEWYGFANKHFKLQELLDRLYQLFESCFGKKACTPNLHNYVHSPIWREKSRLHLISAEPAEDFYGKLKKWHNPRNVHSGKQIAQNSSIAKLAGHKCHSGFTHFAKNSSRNMKDDSFLMDNHMRLFKFRGNNGDGSFKVQRVVTYPYITDWLVRLPWNIVGVFKYGGMLEEFQTLTRKEVVGKAILVKDTIVTWNTDMQKC